jgi:K+-sensing histidine kinase KdpD
MDVWKLRHGLPHSTAPPQPALGDTAGDDTVAMACSSWIGRAVARAAAPSRPRAVSPTAGNGAPAADHTRLCQRELSHDIHHELATIILLASLLESAPDAGPDSRQRARQILGEARWLEQLQQAYDSTVAVYEEAVSGHAELTRLDFLAADVLQAVRLSTSTVIRLDVEEALVYADHLASWRALRNMVDNAVRAAGPGGKVNVSIENSAGWVVAQVDDDGPGFGAGPPGLDSVGLDILREFATACGGYLEIGRSELNGCRIRLCLPTALPGKSNATIGNEEKTGDKGLNGSSRNPF